MYKTDLQQAKKMAHTAQQSAKNLSRSNSYTHYRPLTLVNTERNNESRSYVKGYN